MFEVGKLSDESLDSFLNELEKVVQHLYATKYFCGNTTFQIATLQV